MTEIVRKVKFTSDVSAAVAGIKQVEKAIQDVGVEVKTAGKSQSAFVAELEKAKRSTAIEDLARDYAKLAGETKDADKAAAELLARLEKIGATDDEIKGAARTFSGFQTDEGSGAGLRSFGRELKALPSIRIPGLDIGTDAIGNLTRLSGTLIDVGEKSSVAVRATELLTPALGAQTAATVGAVAPIALLTAAVVAVVAPVLLLAEAHRQAEEAAKAYADQLEADATRRFEISQLVAEGNRGEIQSRVDAAKQNLDLEQSIVDQAFAARDAAQSAKDLEASGHGLAEQYRQGKITWEEYIQTLEDQDTAINGANKTIEEHVPLLQKASEEWHKLSTELNPDQMIALSVEVNTFNATLDGLSEVLDKGTIATLKNAQTTEERTNALIQAEDRLAAMHQQSADKVDTYNDQIDQLNQAFSSGQLEASVANITKSVHDSMEARFTAREKEEDARIAAEGREASHEDRMTQIQTQGNESLERLQDESVKKAAATQKSIDKLQSEARIDDEKALKTYHERIRKIEAEARQKREQAEADMSDARLNFDVDAFRKAQQARAQADKDERKQTRRATRDFDDDKAERARVLNEKIAALNTELAEFQTMQQAKIDAEKLAIQEKLNAEQDAFDESEKRLNEREDRLEERAEARADRLEAYQDTLAEQRQDKAQKAHDDQIAKIEALRDAEVQRMNTLQSNLTTIDTQIAAISTNSEALADASERIAASKWWEQLPTPGVNVPTRDTGGTGVAGQPYLINNRAKPELFIPSSSGRFIPNADRLGGNTTIIHVQAQVGELVTPSEIRRLAQQLRNEYQKGDENVVLGTVDALLEGKKPIR